MNKEEILERSRQENRKRDEMEADTFARAGQLATAVGGIVCMAVILLEGFLAERVNYGTWAVYLSMAGSSSGRRASFLRTALSRLDFPQPFSPDRITLSPRLT